MILRQTLARPINGYWDGGPKQIFDWSIDGSPQSDNIGQFVKIGSWQANHWFHVAVGRTEKMTLANAKRHLRAATTIPCTFEYVKE